MNKINKARRKNAFVKLVEIRMQNTNEDRETAEGFILEYLEQNGSPNIPLDE